MKMLAFLLGTLLVASALIPVRSALSAPPVCGMNNGQVARGAPIPIGAITTMSGLSDFREVNQTVEAYFKCVNANGGVHGRPIAYHYEDDQSKLDTAAQAAKKIVEDEDAYLLVGSTSLVECVANAGYYVQQNILEIGEGLPPQCFTSKNIAEINAGPRQSAIGGADYARRVLHVQSLACATPKIPGADYTCGGVEAWGKKYGVKVTSIYFDLASQDFNSLVLQILATGAGAVMALGPADMVVQLLQAAEQQDAAARMKWLGPTSSYTVRFPGAIDWHYWHDRYWVNTELAPLDSTGPDNQNWIAVMDSYGGNTLRDSFSQAGYIAARVAVRAMLTIADPAKINRETVTAAVRGMPPYITDILCSPWYWGGPAAAMHNANHVTRTVVVADGKWKFVEGCYPDADPDLAPILDLEAKLGMKSAKPNSP